MRLTPADLESVTFQRAPVGRRGYDEAQVDAVFEQVRREMVQLLNERTQLGEEVSRLRQRVYGKAVGDNELGVRPQDAHVQAVRILSQAQQTADQYVADAEEYGRQLAREARRGRDEILAEARARAALIVEEAQNQAARAATAAANAAAGPQGRAAGGRDTHGAGAGTGGQGGRAEPGDRAEADAATRALETEIAYLRTFSEVYRQHLRSYLEALLRNITEWEQSERAGPAPGDVSRLEEVARARAAGQAATGGARGTSGGTSGGAAQQPVRGGADRPSG